MRSFHHWAGPFGAMAIHALGLGFGLLSSVLLVRMLGTEGFGIYGFASSVVAVAAIPLQTGLAMLLVKEVSGCRVTHDHSRLHALVRAANRTVLVYSVIVALGTCGWLWARGSVLSGYGPAVLIAMLLLPALVLAAARGAVLRGLQMPLVGQLPDVIMRPGLLVLMLGTTSVLNYDLSPVHAVGAHVAAAFSGVTLGSIIIRRLIPAIVWRTKPIYAWRAWFNALLPLSAVAGIQAVSASMGIFALAAQRSPAEVAYFRVAELGAAVVSMPLGAVAVYASARVASHFASGDRARLQVELRNFARVAFVAACAVFIPLLLFGERLLGLAFGHAFEAALTPLLILCSAQIANAAAGLVGIVMTMAGRNSDIVRATLFALLLQASLTLFLVPRLGATGAAIASSVGLVAWSQILRWRVRRSLALSTSIR